MHAALGRLPCQQLQSQIGRVQLRDLPPFASCWAGEQRRLVGSQARGLDVAAGLVDPQCWKQSIDQGGRVVAVAACFAMSAVDFGGRNGLPPIVIRSQSSMVWRKVRGTGR